MPAAWSIVCASHMGIESREGEDSNEIAQDILVLRGKQALNEEVRSAVRAALVKARYGGDESVVEADDPLSYAEQHQASDIVNVQAFHDLRAMGLHRLDTQAQTASDLARGFTAHYQPQNFQLACCQVVIFNPLGSVRLYADQGLIDHGVGDCGAQVAFIIV